MTTYSDPGRPSHEAREVAEGFGSDADRYERSRPGYPQTMVEQVVESSPGRNVVDVGCGTGIAGRQFRAAGCRVLGVEPDERMAVVARRSGLTVEVATFEAWDPSGRTFDIMTSGQAWHWVDPMAGAAKAARTLVPGGAFAAIWNAFRPPPALGEAFAEVYQRVETGLPFNPWARSPVESSLVLCDQAEEGLVACGAFEEPERWRFDWEHRYARDEWLDQVPTFGGHAQVSPARLSELLSGIGGAIDELGGSFTMGYATVVTFARRSESAPSAA